MLVSCERPGWQRPGTLSFCALIAMAVGSAISASPVLAVSVNVDVGNVRAVLPLEGLGMGTAVYANQFGNSQLDERLNEAGVTTLRYSGGGYADIYHWSVHKDNPFGNSTDRGYVASGSSFPGLLNIMNNMGNGQAVITVNYGSALKMNGSLADAPDFGGQPQEAAAWVAYANADASIYGTANDVPLGVDQQGNDWKTAGYWAKLRASTAGEYQTWASADGVYNSQNSFLAINRDTPVGIKYWEIGNETFGTGYYGGGTGYSTDYHVPYDGTDRDDHPDLSPAHYGDQVVAYADLMKQVDPTIKIGTVLATPPDDYSWGYADLNDNGSKQANEPYWNDEVLAHAASATDFVMVHWYPQAGNNANGNSLLSQVRTKLPLMMNGTTAGQDTGSNAGLRDTLAAYGISDAEIMVTEFNYFGSLSSSVATPANSLFVADSYATWLENGVTSVQYLELSKNEFVGDSGSLTRGSAFYAIQMLNYMADPGDEAVDSASSSTTIRVHSVLQDDGSVAVMILNTGTTAADVDVVINGGPLSDMGTLYSTTGAGITTTEMTGLGNVFSVAGMPGRTNYLFVIPPVASLAGDFNGDHVVDAADYTVWRNGLGSTYTLDDYDDWKTHFGETLPGGGSAAAASVPEPATWLLCLGGLLAGVVSRRRVGRHQG
jgi:PEP-CTERM motif